MRWLALAFVLPGSPVIGLKTARFIAAAFHAHQRGLVCRPGFEPKARAPTAAIKCAGISEIAWLRAFMASSSTGGCRRDRDC